MQRTKNMIGISLFCLAGLTLPAAALAGGYHKGVFSGFEMPAGNKAKAPIKVSGTVTDEAGKPVEGVSIVTKTGSTGAVTDFKGNFSFTVEEGAMLVFSSAGYVSQELTAAGDMKVVLKTDFKENETVVAIGYTKQRKSDLTGAISSVKAGEMNLSSPTLSQALVGKVAGVQVSQVSGAPYAGTKIRVRGTGSINASSEPLYVVDGYAVGGNTSAGPGNGGTGTGGFNANTNGNDLFINPDDIESIEVLKDAASAAIYGSRAAAGVVLITTKRGKLGKGKFEYNTQVSVNQLAKKVKLMNSQEWAELFVDGRNGAYRDALEAQGVVWNDSFYSDDNATRTAKTGGNQIIPYLYDFPTQTVKTPEFDTDWQDVVYRNAFSHRHTLSFSGGKEGLRYAISGGYQDAPGIMRETYMKRTNFRANIDGEISKKFRVAANVSYTGTNAREAQEGRFNQGVVMNTLLMMPIFPVYNADGSLQIGQTSQRVDGYTFAIQPTENPLAMLERIKTTRQGNRATFNGTATYDIANGLSAKINLGTQQYSEKYEYYYPTNLASGENPPGSAAAINAARAVAQNLTLTDRMAEFTLNYNKEFGKSKLDLLGGYSAQETVSDILAFTGSNFSNDLIPEITGRGADAASLSMNGNTGKSVTTLISYLGRAMYNYDSRYFLSASIRADASSRFGPENRWGYFPSVSAGWSLSDEKFYNNWLGEGSTVKVRASWGLSGNNNIGNYRYSHLLGTPGGTVIGGSVVNATWPGQIADPALGWESTSQYNIGADIGLFGGRINLIANYYNGRSFNLLYNQNISAIAGTSQYLTNLRNSDIRNIGYDFQLDARVIRSKDFSLNFSGNITFNKNEVRSLDGAPELR
ncbi:MAG: SusC/RagA family TonB-linked outer membrane protein, partial [Chitinophagaceae bacterium]